ncbi:MAG: LacI family DNA-binding transcriptional regulator [Victivallaceae bacterium]|nr:LacI family DNA-binding transcriptional regulator [Victivallaceae bacterium]
MTNIKKSNSKAVSRGDVARAAGVSATTVTHALNPPANVRMNSETKERVCRIAREMGYRPNFFGRSLVTGKSFAIGFLQPEYEALFLEFYQHMAYGLASSMAKDDYNLLMAFKDERKNYLKLVRQGRVDGMIVLQSKSTADDLKEIAATGIPTIMLNQPYDCIRLENCANIISDHQKLANDIMEEFIKRKRKNILCANDYNFCVPNLCVFDAFQLKSKEFIKDGVKVVHLLPPEENFEKQISNLFESGQRFDGIYIDGEELVEAYVRIAHKYGMECGKDYDLHISSVKPELSPSVFDFPLTMHIQQGEKMGSRAWETMNKIINKEEFNKQIKIPYQLNKR